MSMYLDFGLFKIPAYGTMIVTGALIANLVVILLILKRDKKNVWDFIIIEGYGLLGGIIGSKLLYILINLLTSILYFSSSLILLKRILLIN